MKKIEMVEKKFNMLTVMLDVGYSHGQQSYLCVCDCGNKLVVTGQRLRNGESKSCGCLARKLTKIRNRKHGLAHTSIYRIWAKIKMRCTNTNDPSYKDYGGRGINMCDEWFNSFEQFYKDMGDKPEGLSLDRIDNNKGYFKENCRWATKSEQSKNRRNTIFLEYNNKIMCLKDWSIELNKPYSSMKMYFKKGLSIEQIIGAN
jgi:hypothetical protein